MNKGEENKDVSGIDEKNEDFLKNKIVVHTMPKNFKKVKSDDGKHLGIGVLIMAGGLFLLIGFGVLSYYFIVKKDIFSFGKKDKAIVLEEKILNDNIKDLTNIATTSTTTVTTIATTSDEVIGEVTSSTDSLIDEISNDLATSSSDLSATSSDLSATSSDLSATSSDDVASSTLEVVPKGNNVVEIVEAIDTDADGLSDLEEGILGTDLNKMDSDNDGYSDFQELDNMYDPVGNGILSNNKSITSYANLTHKYSIIYPSSWTFSNFDEDNSVMFKIDNSQFVQIAVELNSEKQTLEDWYKKQFNVSVINESQKVLSKKDWNGLTSEDGLNYFFAKAGIDKVFVVSYNLGINNVVGYRKLFEMIANSLEVSN